MNPDTRLIIKSRADIDEKESTLLAEWARDIFGDAELAYEWAVPDWRLLLWWRRDLVCTLAIVERTVKAGTVPIRVGGIGNVMTPPQWRRRGFARTAVEAAVDFMRDTLKLDAGVLLCSSQLVPYYRSMGWQHIEEPVSFRQPQGQVQWHEEAMILPCRRRDWPDGPIDLCGLPW